MPAGQKKVLGWAGLVMALGAGATTAIPMGLKFLVDAVERGPDPPGARFGSRSRDVFLSSVHSASHTSFAKRWNVLRRYLVENSCTRIDKELCVKLVGHLMEVDLATLSHEQVGAIHGRINRSVEGFIRFLRISLLDFVPAILTGTFALICTFLQQPKIALVMAGVVPISVGLTLWQLVTQKGVRVDLLRIREAMDGTVVEQLAGIDYVRAADSHRQEVVRIERAAERRRSKEIRHHFQMSLFRQRQGRSTRHSSTCW